MVMRTLTFAVATLLTVTVSGCKISCTAETEFQIQALAASSAETVRLGTTIEKQAGSDNLDVHGFNMDLDLNDAVLDTTVGTFTARVRNGNQALASRQFQFYTQGNRLYPSNPSAIESWLKDFDGHADQVELSARVDVSPSSGNTDSGSLTNRAIYNGQTYASAYTSLDFSGSDRGCGYFCEIQ